MRPLAAITLIAAASISLAQDSAQIFSGARAAILRDRAAKEMELGGAVLTGEAEFLGNKGSYSLLYNSSGHFVEEIRTELGQTTGWNGTIGWAHDWSGVTRKLELEDLEAEQAVIWIITGRWLAKDSPFSMSYVEGSKPARIKLKLRDRILEAELTLDEKLRPAKMTRQSAAGDDIYEFGEYKQLSGLWLPTKFSITSAGMKQSFSVTEATKAPIFVRNPYEPIFAVPLGTQFDAAVSSEIPLKRAFSGHLLVNPMVDGKDIGWFILDTGAGSMVIDSAAANRLSLKTVGKIPAVGVGGVVESSFRKSASFSLGPLKYSNPVYVDLDLSEISKAFGVQIAGICGYDLLARGVFELDLKKNTLAIKPAEDYTLSGGAWTPIKLDGKHPIVPMAFDGGTGLFRLDTGANNALIFHTHTVEKYKLLDGRETRPSSLSGVGGSIEARTGKIDWLEIGGSKFENVTVDFSLAKSGAFADRYTQGNIGSYLLRTFKLVFDYSKSRIAFLPSTG
jgi:predicted aspartyl protease